MPLADSARLFATMLLDLNSFKKIHRKQNPFQGAENFRMKIKTGEGGSEPSSDT